LDGFIDRLVTRLLSTELSDWGAVSRRETGESDGLLEYLWDFREQFGPWALELATEPDLSFRFLAGRFIRWAYEQNQFFELDDRGGRRFAQAHRLLALELGQALSRSENIETFARHANRALLHFVERLASVFRTIGAAGVLLGKGAEYSAELQLSLLGLAEQKLLEPVVDLGCGKSAELVAHLRSTGVDVAGIDRLGSAPFVLAKDWFEVRFEPSSIGTIVSHLAFSLQFLHHHWHPGERAYAYAKKYMELLQSLKPGGLFVYAPGLPFIEAMLDENSFRVEKRALPEPLATQMESFRDLGTGQSVAYVTHVERL
jgi:SAM-dependent methyltransferase